MITVDPEPTAAQPNSSTSALVRLYYWVLFSNFVALLIAGWYYFGGQVAEAGPWALGSTVLALAVGCTARWWAPHPRSRGIAYLAAILHGTCGGSLVLIQLLPSATGG